MTVSSSTNVAGPYSCNGSQTTFSVPFKYLDTDHIKVYLVTVADSPVTYRALHCRATSSKLRADM